MRVSLAPPAAAILPRVEGASRLLTRAGRHKPSLLGLLGSLGLATLVAGAFLLATHGVTSRTTDYFVRYSAAKLVLQGHGGSMYDPHALGHLQRVLARPLRIDGRFLPNPLPPWYVFLTVPFAALPYNTGYVLWFLLNLTLLTASVYALERYARLTWRAGLVFRQLTLVSLPVMVALVQGQSSMIHLASLTITFLAARARHDAIAGMALAATLAKPQFALPILLLFLLRRRWRLLAAFSATGLALTILPMLILGPGINGPYVDTLREAGGWGAGVGGFAPALNRSFAGLAQLLVPGLVGRVLTAVLDLAALAILVRAALRPVPLDLPFALAVVVSPLVSGHVLIHGLTMLVIPAAILLRHRAEIRLPVVPLLAGLYLTVWIGVPLALRAPIQLPTIAMSILALFLLAAVERKHRGAGADPRIDRRDPEVESVVTTFQRDRVPASL